MYTSNKRQRKHRVFLKFTLFVIPFIVLIGVLVWYVFYRTSGGSSSSFSKAGAEVAVVKREIIDISTDLFKISLPTSWQLLGKKNPYSSQVYYEFQNIGKNIDNRWLRVYVDVFPKDYAVTQLLPINVVNNKLIPGELSDECNTFTGAPLSDSAAQQAGQKWSAKWREIEFMCDMSKIENSIGTASADEGYGITMPSKNGTSHKYFFVYIDHNVRPDKIILSEAVKSFETL